MIKTGTCSVEIFVSQEEIITFDFGNFGIVVINYPIDEDEEVLAYFGTDYEKYFIGEIYEIIDENSLKAVIISLESLKKIREAANSWQDQGGRSYEYGNLWSILDAHFSEYLKKYKSN